MLPAIQCSSQTLSKKLVGKKPRRVGLLLQTPLCQPFSLMGWVRKKGA